jgi:HEAT repeat protein/uncharacterized membrane protein/energy-coupling factor transporter ATP-binding protein EcfA2
MAACSEPVEPDFDKYFASISEKCDRWWNFYTLTDTLDRQSQNKAGFSHFDSPFDFGLMVEKVEPKQGKQEKCDRLPTLLPVLEGIRKYVAESKHVLLIGKPGSGKSTALQRLLWEEARAIIQGEKRKIPVLIELRRWDTSLETLIYKVLRSHKYHVDEDKIGDLLVDGEFLLLIDGLNELPSDEARDKVAGFRQYYPDTGMVFTTRDLAVGGNLGIDEQLEIQPLTVNQIQNSIRNYFPDRSENLLRQLENRLRELGETPFILKMLCDIFESSGEIPKNKGELFRKFDSKVNNFKENKESVPIPEGLRNKKKELLSYLAFEMMQSENPQVNPVDFSLSISRDRAEAILEKFLTGKTEYPWQKAKDYLEGLLKHCLLESTTSELDRVTIQFHHQLFQEYYAAEYLLRLLELKKLSDRKLQRDYLNLLKWTESIAIALALVDKEAQAVHIVKLALDMDLMLGARLVGEVKEEFQEETVGLILNLDFTQSLKIELLGITRSKFARSSLLRIWGSGYFDNMENLAVALSEVGDDKAISKLRELEDKHQDEMNNAAFDEDWDNEMLRDSIADELKNVELSNISILNILKLLNDHKLLNKGSDKFLKPRNYRAKKILGEEIFNQCLSLLLDSLNDEDYRVRYRAALALINIESDVEVRDLVKAVEDENYFVRLNAVIAFGKYTSNKVVKYLIKALRDKYSLIRSHAAEALAKFHSDEVAHALIQLLNDESYLVRSNAVQSLRQMKCEYVLKYLIQTFNDESYNVRHSAVNAIVGFSKDNYNNQLVINSLIHALRDKESSISSGAAYTLRKIADASEEKSKHDLIDSILDKQSLTESIPVQIEEIVEIKFLPIMQSLLLIATNEMKELILTVQNKYKFYNHEIFHSPPIEDEKENKYQPIVNHFHAEVGIVNTGKVDIHGNQIGLQDGKSIQ